MRKWIVGFTLVFLVLLALNIIPEQRGGWGWRWPYATPTEWNNVAVLALIVGLYIAGAYSLRRWVMPALLWSIVAAFMLAVSVQTLKEYPPFFTLFSHTVSPVQTGASRVAVQYFAEDGFQETLHHWPEFIREARLKTITHFTTSPPGQAVVHYWIGAVADEIDPVSRPISMALRPYQCSTAEVMAYSRGELVSAGAGMLMPVWAALAVIPIFLAGRQLTDSKDAALRIAQWWPLVPSMLMFAPSWNTFYPVLSTTALVLFQVGLYRQQMRWFLAAGVVVSVCTFTNFAFLPLLALFGVYTLVYAYVKRKPFLWAVWVGVCFGVGLSSTWVLYTVYAERSPLDIIDVIFDQHFDIEQNYFIWVILHIYDMLMFAGWPLILLGIWGAWRGFSHIRSHQADSMDIFSLTVVFTILATGVSGLSRGETARVWLFLVPFMLLAGASFIRENQSRWDIPLLASQAASVVVMAAFLPVVIFDMKPPIEGPRTDMVTLEPIEFIPLDYTFSSQHYVGRFTLDAYRYVADPGQQAITVEFLWSGHEQVERPYLFRLVASSENDIDGLVVSEPVYWYPQNGNYLTTCWQPNDTIHDIVLIQVPPVAQPVEWELTLQVYDVRTGDIATVNGQPTIQLGPISYP